MAEQNVVIKIQADVSKATSDVKALQQVIAKLSTSGTQAAAGTQKVSNAAKKTATASQLLDKEIKKVVAGQGDLTKVAELATRALAEQEAVAKRLAKVSEAVEGAVGKKGSAVLGANKQIGGLADASGAASFALLSLGQAFQDSAQFGMGFAQGFRAINNNIQQTFTAIALGSIQAGGFNNLLKLMGGSLWGPAGLILGFSAVTAAVEFFSTRAQRAEKETSRLNDALKESAEQMTQVSGIDQKKYEFQIENLGTVISQLEKELGLVQAVTEAKRNESLTNTYSYSEQLRLQGAVTKAQNELNDATGVLTESERKAKEAVLEVLRTRLAEAEANKLIQAELERLGAQQVENIKTSEELLADQTAEAARRNEQAGALPPILDAQVELYKMMGEAEKAAEVAATARELRELGIKAAIDAQNLALQQRADAAGEDSFLPEGDLELGKRLITDADRAMQRLNKTFQNTAAQGMTQVISGFAEMAFSGASFSAAILGPLADMAIRLGKIAIATAIAMRGIKMSFKSPATALAAGIALVAVGSAVKAAIKGASGGQISTSGASSSAARPNFTMPNPLTSPASFNSQGMFPATSNAPSFSGRFVASGRDLVAVVSAETDARQELGFTRNLVIEG